VDVSPQLFIIHISSSSFFCLQRQPSTQSGKGAYLHTPTIEQSLQMFFPPAMQDSENLGLWLEEDRSSDEFLTQRVSGTKGLFLLASKSSRIFSQGYNFSM
jgi:hypothetical protein